MTAPTNCRFCRSVVYRADLVTVRTCRSCWEEDIDVRLKSRSLWARRGMRRALRSQREIERYRWEV